MLTRKFTVTITMVGLAMGAASACASDTADEPSAESMEQVAVGDTTTTSAASSGDQDTSTSVEPVPDDPWDDITGWSGASFGRVRTLFFDRAFSFDAPEGARLLCPPAPTHTGVSVRGENVALTGPIPGATVPAGLHAFMLADSTVEETVATLAAGLEAATEPQPTSVGGAPGLTFDATAPETAETMYISPTGDCSAKFDLGEAWRFWIVDVDGRPVTLALYAPATDFEVYAAELRPVIDSIKWQALSNA